MSAIRLKDALADKRPSPPARPARPGAADSRTMTSKAGAPVTIDSGRAGRHDDGRAGQGRLPRLGTAQSVLHDVWPPTH